MIGANSGTRHVFGGPCGSESHRVARDRGGVAAEFAVAMPAVILVLALVVGAVVATGAQVRVQDAAGEAARMAARGDSASAGAAIAGQGAGVEVWDDGEFRCARVSAAVPIAGLSLGVTAQAESCALRDEGR